MPTPDKHANPALAATTLDPLIHEGGTVESDDGAARRGDSGFQLPARCHGA